MTTGAELVAEAQTRAGLDDLGSDHMLPLLEAVACDIDGNRLSERGRAVVRSMVVRGLVRRLQMVETFKQHPEIDDVVLPPIVHVSGLARSGTTLLHNLLDRHPGVRTLRSWELKQPLPPPTADTYATDPRIAAADAALAPLRGSALERQHWVEATDPDESQWAMTDLHGLLGGGAGAALPCWSEVATDRERSLVAAFRELRRTLKLLLWRNPVTDGQVLVLKDPTTTAHLRDFVEVFPDTPVVVVHRDPHRVAVSVRATLAAVAAPLVAAEDLAMISSSTDDVRDLLANAIVGLMDGLTAAGEHVRSLSYPDLASAPVATAARLLDALGLDGQDARFLDDAGAYLAWQREGGRARPRSTYDEGGLTRDLVLADPAVAEYVARYEVAPETRRLTGQ